MVTAIKTKVEIGGIEYTDAKSVTVDRNMGEYNATSNFSIDFDNVASRHSTDFNINDEVIISADQTTGAVTTKIFLGIVEDIKFKGKGTKEDLELTGRDYGTILHDIMVTPRIFKDAEISSIVHSIMVQNVPSSAGITRNNVDATSTTLTKITFNNVSMFDALKRLAELAGFYFYVDEDKDLHFKLRESISTGETLDSTNVTRSSFRVSDGDVFNNIKVVGDRQLTGAREEFTTGTDNTGSLYTLEAKPFNTTVITSGATNAVLKPGGIIHIDDPGTDDVKYLVDFNSRGIILTSGTTGGDNILATGSVLIIDYQRSTPLIVTKKDSTSISTYGQKDKTIINRNIKDTDEATDVANTYLSEHKDPRLMGNVKVKGVWDLVPGKTITVDLPSQNVGSDYAIINVKYDFTPENNLSNKVLNLTLNKKISDFIDIIKDQEIRLRILEGAEVDTSVTTLAAATGSIGVSGVSISIQTSIGSAFYFHVPNHDILNSPKALLGDMRTGSIVFQDGIKQ